MSFRLLNPVIDRFPRRLHDPLVTIDQACGVLFEFLDEIVKAGFQC